MFGEEHHIRVPPHRHRFMSNLTELQVADFVGAMTVTHMQNLTKTDTTLWFIVALLTLDEDVGGLTLDQCAIRFYDASLDLGMSPTAAMETACDTILDLSHKHCKEQR